VVVAAVPRPVITWLARLRDLSPRTRQIVGSGVAGLAMLGAFLYWGPVPIGAGPLHINWTIDSEAVVSGTDPSAISVPLDAGSSGAVVDGVAIATTRRYPAPAILAVHSNRDTYGCLGPVPLTGPDNYYTFCAYGGATTIGPLIGQPIPVSSTVQAPRSIQTQPGIGAMIVLAPPQGTPCWTITSVAVYYHVGLKHYTATARINLAACSTQRAAQLLEGP
jgi:hypothetical protein